MERFDHRTATEDEILERAMLLEGVRLGDIPRATFPSADPRRGRQEAGHAIEAWFGIPPNPSPQPDFPAAGIELKAVPLVATEGGLRVKERTVISLIDYDTIVDETWETASVRKKLRILFVYIEHLRGRPETEFPIHGVLLWEPEGAVEEQIRLDWETVRDKVAQGLAHELSEPMVASWDRAPRVPRQPPSDRSASNALGRFVGLTIDDAAAELAIRSSRAKDYAARVVHAAVASASPVPRNESERIGPTVRMTRIGPICFPYGALSFPSFPHPELVEETWQDSTLLSQIEHMLIVAVFGPRRETPHGDCLIREPVYWRPTPDQLRAIEQEWTMFRDLVAAGKAGALPTAAYTTALHVRPHGTDAADEDRTPGGGSQVRRSFWLNKRFVQAILTGTHASLAR